MLGSRWGLCMKVYEARGKLLRLCTYRVSLQAPLSEGLVVQIDCGKLHWLEEGLLCCPHVLLNPWLAQGQHQCTREDLTHGLSPNFKCHYGAEIGLMTRYTHMFDCFGKLACATCGWLLRSKGTLMGWTRIAAVTHLMPHRYRILSRLCCTGV